MCPSIYCVLRCRREGRKDGREEVGRKEGEIGAKNEHSGTNGWERKKEGRRQGGKDQWSRRGALGWVGEVWTDGVVLHRKPRFPRQAGALSSDLSASLFSEELTPGKSCSVGSGEGTRFLLILPDHLCFMGMASGSRARSHYTGGQGYVGMLDVSLLSLLLM